ncbi:MAG: TonB family protein [Acidobacteriota bacterium]
MFDKLIESEPTGADFKNRRGYFLASTVMVGILFLTAVVISIYAQDFALGSERFELEALLAPVEMAAAAPEPVRRRDLASTPSASTSNVPVRTVNMSRTDEPTIVPDGLSVERNTAMARPRGDFQLGNENSNPSGVGRDSTGSEASVGPSTLQASTRPSEVREAEITPPPVKVAAEKPHPTKSLGVINGMAESLPKPVYSAAAIAMHADGAVSVQVLIDESGKVVSATAMNGNLLLRNAAVDAARKAKFTPTLLSNVPVKVTGTIVYHFNR